NALGLTAGLACCLLALLYVRDEHAYDRHHPRADDVVRLVDDLHFKGRFEPSPIVPANWAADAAEAFPEVEAVVRFDPNWGSRLVRTPAPAEAGGETSVYEPGHRFYRTDPTVFDVFAFDLVQGDPATALEAPNAVVLTETTARKYFGDADPMGQRLTVSDEEEYVVTGVLADLAATSHLQFGFLTSMNGLPAEEWPRRWVYSYLLLRPGTDADALAPRLADHLHGRYGEGLRGVNRVRPELQPLTDIHLHSDLLYEMRPNSDAAVVRLFAFIAGIILLVACINYMNMATASAAGRAKEVGVRKAIGARRGQVAGQFVGEALLLVGVSVVGAVGLVILALPAFNGLAEKAITPDTLHSGWFVASLLGLIVVVSGVAGSYPALVLSRFRPSQVMRGGRGSGGRALGVRRGLVVVQFTAAAVMTVATLVVRDQLRFFQTRDLGFDAEQIVTIPIRTEGVQQQLEALRTTWLTRTDVTAVSFASSLPGEINTLYTLRMQPEGAAPEDASLVQAFYVDPDFARTLGIGFVAGRDFARALATDTSALVLNETAVALFDWTPTTALGKTVVVRGEPREVVGVVEDFHFDSLHEAIAPVGFLAETDPAPFGVAVARLQTGDLPAALAGLEAGWARHAPDLPYEFAFLDDALDRLYRAEQRQATLFTGFAALALLLSALGLFGLAAFTAQQRTKEIGIRKALGASVSSILVLLSTDFARLIALALVVATPVAWVAMDRWLDGFAYRVEIEPGLFALAGLATAAVALVAVSYHALRAATADPVAALRSE
ncbi:MAG: FtsX-like permease family protein, partial [Rhodothermales bacterium]|nr:FtsX-like permease family protein [Rhodothermales bacterium]